jgi:hypothetical protein
VSLLDNDQALDELIIDRLVKFSRTVIDGNGIALEICKDFKVSDDGVYERISEKVLDIILSHGMTPSISSVYFEDDLILYHGEDTGIVVGSNESVFESAPLPVEALKTLREFKQYYDSCEPDREG